MIGCIADWVRQASEGMMSASDAGSSRCRVAERVSFGSILNVVISAVFRVG